MGWALSDNEHDGEDCMAFTVAIEQTGSAQSDRENNSGTILNCPRTLQPDDWPGHHLTDKSART
jgi:hypothetical protein